MSLEGLSTRVNRVIAWADRLQRRRAVLGFPYAVVKKFGDDEGGREAALITYYGFLSVFPLLLLGVAVLSRVLALSRTLEPRTFKLKDKHSGCQSAGQPGAHVALSYKDSSLSADLTTYFP